MKRKIASKVGIDVVQPKIELDNEVISLNAPPPTPILGVSNYEIVFTGDSVTHNTKGEVWSIGNFNK